MFIALHSNISTLKPVAVLATYPGHHGEADDECLATMSYEQLAHVSAGESD